MGDRERQLTLLVTDDEKSPFEQWYKKLKDRKTRRSILVMLTRLQDRSFKNYKSVGKGVYELRLFLGPGYRIYFAFEEDEIVVLVLGGDKASQSEDIRRSQKLWKEYQNEKESNRRKFTV